MIPTKSSACLKLSNINVATVLRLSNLVFQRFIVLIHLSSSHPPLLFESTQPALSDLDLQLLVLTLLSRDLPRETSIMAACLTGSGRLKLSGLEDMADLLSLFDHVLAELGEDFPSQSQRCGGGGMGEKKEGEDGRKVVGLKAKVKRLLKTTGKKLEVSQRSAGAVHSLLRSLGK